MAKSAGNTGMNEYIYNTKYNTDIKNPYKNKTKGVYMYMNMDICISSETVLT